MKSRKHTPGTQSAPARSTAPSRASGGGRGNAYAAERLKQGAPAKSAPTAGPSEDDRGIVNMPDKPLEGDLKARILWASVLDGSGALDVKFSAGLQQGLFEGMNLSLISGNGRPLADITVWDVTERLSRAMVKPEIGRVTLDQISGEGSSVILRPR